MNVTLSKSGRAFLKKLVTMSLPQINGDALQRAMAESMGFTLRTPEQVAAYRKRAKAAKLGWARRKRTKIPQ